jgi:hypothetical protein
MTRMMFISGIARRKLYLLAALFALVAASGPVAMSALAVHSDEPTVTVEKLTGLTTYPDDISATIKLRLANRAHGGGQPVLEEVNSYSRRTHVIQLEEFDNVVMAKITFEDGAVIPWHTHPGAAVVSVAAGALTVTNAGDCVPRTYGINKGFVDPGHGNVHMAQAQGETVVFVTFFEVPDDGVMTIPAADPGCSAT